VRHSCGKRSSDTAKPGFLGLPVSVTRGMEARLDPNLRIMGSATKPKRVQVVHSPSPAIPATVTGRPGEPTPGLLRDVEGPPAGPATAWVPTNRPPVWQLVLGQSRGGPALSWEPDFDDGQGSGLPCTEPGWPRQ
jgi:hypothetical protein